MAVKKKRRTQLSSYTTSPVTRNEVYRMISDAACGTAAITARLDTQLSQLLKLLGYHIVNQQAGYQVVKTAEPRPYCPPKKKNWFQRLVCGKSEG